jgi:hypothetical protein
MVAIQFFREATLKVLYFNQRRKLSCETGDVCVCSVWGGGLPQIFNHSHCRLGLRFITIDEHCAFATETYRIYILQLMTNGLHSFDNVQEKETSESSEGAMTYLDCTRLSNTPLQVAAQHATRPANLGPSSQIPTHANLISRIRSRQLSKYWQPFYHFQVDVTLTMLTASKNRHLLLLA